MAKAVLHGKNIFLFHTCHPGKWVDYDIDYKCVNGKWQPLVGVYVKHGTDDLGWHSVKTSTTECWLTFDSPAAEKNLKQRWKQLCAMRVNESTPAADEPDYTGKPIMAPIPSSSIVFSFENKPCEWKTRSVYKINWLSKNTNQLIIYSKRHYPPRCCRHS